MYEPPQSQLENSAAPVLDGFFNILVVISIILTFIAWGLPYVEPYYLSEEELSLLSYSGYGAFFPSSSIVYWTLLIFWIVMSIGLILRSRIIRTLYVTGIIITTLWTVFWGFSVTTPLESLIYNILSMIDGALITMAYLTSVSRSFD